MILFFSFIKLKYLPMVDGYEIISGDKYILRTVVTHNKQLIVLAIII